MCASAQMTRERVCCEGSGNQPCGLFEF